VMTWFSVFARTNLLATFTEGSGETCLLASGSSPSGLAHASSSHVIAPVSVLAVAFLLAASSVESFAAWGSAVVSDPPGGALALSV